MEKEKRKENKTIFHIVEVILFAGYLILGILLFLTGGHCTADSAIFVIGLIAAIICAVLLFLYERK